jgi:hypothetical protein
LHKAGGGALCIQSKPVSRVMHCKTQPQHEGLKPIITSVLSLLG